MPAPFRPVLAFALLLAIAIPAGAAETGHEERVRLANTRCLDGRPIDPHLEPVVIRYNGRAYSINVGSRENADALRKMAPVEALRAVIAANRDLAGQIPLDGTPPK